MGDWFDLVRAAGEGPWVLVTVAAVRGSAPREPGAAMVVCRDRVLGTIGGGTLEHEATVLARRVLDGHEQLPPGGVVRRYTLGTDLSQCCGGVAFLHYEAWLGAAPEWLQPLASVRAHDEAATLVSRPGWLDAVIVTGRDLLPVHRLRVDDAAADGGAVLEPVEADPVLTEVSVVTEARHRLAGQDAADLLWSASGETPGHEPVTGMVLMRPTRTGDFRLVICGAGHVGRALVKVIAPVVDRIDWCDARGDQFPSAVPANVHVHTTDAFEVIAAQPRGGFYLIMTHNHGLDLLLCEAVLARGDFAHLGLIGSVAKRERFERHLRAEGYDDQTLARLVCPIGVPGIRSKVPEAIAIGVAAQVLQVRY